MDGAEDRAPGPPPAPSVTASRFVIAPWADVAIEADRVRARAGDPGALVQVDGAAAAEVVRRVQVAAATSDELVTGLRRRHDVFAVLSAVADLHHAGILVREGDDGAGTTRSRSSSSSHSVDLVGRDEVRHILGSRLRVAGLAVTGPDTGGPDAADLQLVAVTDVRESFVTDADEAARQRGKPWCLVHLGGPRPWVGPIFVPGATACGACLQHRYALMQPLAPPLDLTDDAHRSVDPATATLVAGLVATMLRGFRDGRGPSAEPGQVWEVDPDRIELRTHRVVRWSRCPRCSRPGGRTVTGHPPISLEPRPCVAGPLGTRLVPAERTVAELERFVSPLFGPIAELRAVLDPPLHVWMAGGNPAVAADGAVRRSLRRFASGKGTTAVDARAGALAEALERLQGEFTGDEPRVRARLADLPGALDPNDVQLYSAAQLAGGRAVTGKDRIPPPFDPTSEQEWTPLWSLSAGADRWLPTSICYSRYAGGSGWVANSNGCGAGSTVGEAILGGLLELVERDAVGIWWLNRMRRPAFDLDHLADPWLTAVRELLRRAGRPIHVLDLTSDLGIPVAGAVSGPPGREPSGQLVLMGFGAHPDARVAVRRAVAEMVQMLAAVPLGAPATARIRRWAHDPVTQRWADAATVENQPYLMPDPASAAAPVTPPGPTRPPGPPDVVAQLAEVQARVEQAGSEVLVLDQTRPEIGFPTVRVVAPGLRHFWHRLAPGRLYEVPVALGWRTTPMAEDEANPFTMPM